MPKRVLVCDDSLLMRKIIGETLSQTGWLVVGEAADGAEAVESYQALRPDVVTMDIVMPGMDGIEALRRIREADPQAKVVVVSALEQTKAISNAIRGGAQDFLVKPFLPEQLLATIEGCVASAS
jgi:two-component system chemotaxis response regulator CheY